VAIGRQPDEHGEELSLEQWFDRVPSSNVIVEIGVDPCEEPTPNVSLTLVVSFCDSSFNLFAHGIQFSVSSDPCVGKSV
jgi:hypothetical protein